MRFHRPGLLLLAALVAAPALAQNSGKSGYDRANRATLLHDAVVYIAADPNSQRVAQVLEGHEVVISEHNGDWVKVFANIDTPDAQSDDQQPEFTDDSQKSPPISGWIRDKGVLTPQTPSGDVILYGAAASEEEAAAEPHAPANAASAAHLLYRRVADYFPNSPFAPAAAWRSADIRWQLDQHDIHTLPSAKEQEAYLRPQVYEGELKRVIKTYPNTKYAALAAYDLLDNKLCGDWQGLPKCPEMEAGLYMKYAKQYSDGPKTAQALFNATYRIGVTVTMWTVQDERKRSEAAVKNTVALADEARQRFPDSDFSARAQAIAYQVQQGIPVYGSDRD